MSNIQADVMHRFPYTLTYEKVVCHDDASPYVPSLYVFLGSYVPWTISAPWTICPLEDASLTNVFRPQGADPPPLSAW
jgi:hypothetical protein